MALYGRDANGADAYIRGTGAGTTADGYLTFHDVFSDEIKFASATLTASGDLVTAVAGSKIRVISLTLSSSAACTVQFQSNATTDISGLFTLPADGLAHASSEFGLFETSSGHKLNAVLTGTVSVGVTLSYREVVG